MVLGYGETDYVEPGVHPEFSIGGADPEAINYLSLIFNSCVIKVMS